VEKNEITRTFQNVCVWLIGFIRRHPSIGQLFPELILAARSSGAGRSANDSLIHFLWGLLGNNKTVPLHLYDTNEAGVQTSKQDEPKFFPRREKR
jgi:hypothetical protein